MKVTNFIENNTNLLLMSNSSKQDALKNDEKEHKPTYVMCFSEKYYQDKEKLYQDYIISYGKCVDKCDGKELTQQRFYVAQDSRDRPEKGDMKFLVATEFAFFFKFFHDEYEKFAYPVKPNYTKKDKDTIGNEVSKHVNEFMTEMVAFFSVTNDTGLLELYKYEDKASAQAGCLMRNPSSNAEDKWTNEQTTEKVKVRVYFSLKKLASLNASGEATDRDAYLKELKTLKKNLDFLKGDDNSGFKDYVLEKIRFLMNTVKDDLIKHTQNQNWDEACKQKVQDNLETLINLSKDNSKAIDQLLNITAINKDEFIERGQKLNEICKNFQIIDTLHSKIPSQLVGETDWEKEKKELDNLFALYDEKIKAFSFIPIDGKLEPIEKLETETLKLEKLYQKKYKKLTNFIKTKLIALKNEVENASLAKPMEDKLNPLLEEIDKLSHILCNANLQQVIKDYIQVKIARAEFLFKNEDEKFKEVLKERQQCVELASKLAEKIAEEKSNLEKLKNKLDHEKKIADSDSLHSQERDLSTRLETLASKNFSGTDLDSAKNELKAIQKLRRNIEDGLAEIQRKRLQDSLVLDVTEEKSKLEKLKNEVVVEQEINRPHHASNLVLQRNALDSALCRLGKLEQSLECSLPLEGLISAEEKLVSIREKLSLDKENINRNELNSKFSTKMLDIQLALNKIVGELTSKVAKLEIIGNRKGKDSIAAEKSRMLRETEITVNKFIENINKPIKDDKELSKDITKLLVFFNERKNVDTLAKQRNWYTFWKKNTASEKIVDKLKFHLKQVDEVITDIYKAPVNDDSNTSVKRLMP